MSGNEAAGVTDVATGSVQHQRHARLDLDGAESDSRAGAPLTIVAKIGTSSLTSTTGRIDHAAIARVGAQVARLRADGHRVVVVSSGAVAAGLEALGLGDRRPGDVHCPERQGSPQQPGPCVEWSDRRRPVVW